MGKRQETTFARTEEGRSGAQEIKVRSPELKQLKGRDRTTFQDILDLTDWRVLHMTSTPGTVQQLTEWATEGRSRGSGFKITSTVSIRGIPSRPQLEVIKWFLANSLLLELKSIQVSADDSRPVAGAHGMVTVTIQVRSRHRARETARELKEWMTSSLEDILVEGGLWETGIGSPAPG